MTFLQSVSEKSIELDKTALPVVSKHVHIENTEVGPIQSPDSL